jgi:hypothetical protein
LFLPSACTCQATFSLRPPATSLFPRSYPQPTDGHPSTSPAIDPFIQALRIAASKAKNVRFDGVHHRASEQPRGREAPRLRPPIPDRTPRIRPPSNSVARASPPAKRNQARVAPAPPPARPRQQPSSEKPKPNHQPRKAKRHAEKHNDRPSRGAAKERSLRCKPWDRSQKQSSSEGAKEGSRSILRQGRELERIRTDPTSRSRNPRRNGRKLARSPHRIRVRRNQRTEQRSPLRLLSRPHQNLADKRLRGLRH